MSKTTRKMPSFEGVAAGQTATIRLPIGRTFEQLLITYDAGSGTAAEKLANLKELRIIGNGEVIHRITDFTKLNTMNLFEGRQAAAGVIAFDFNRYGLITRAAQEFTALGTGIVGTGELTTLTAEIDLGAIANPSLSAKAHQSDPRPVGLIKKTKQFIYTAGAAGEFEISDLPKGDSINKIFIGNNGVLGITKFTIEVDNFILYERSAAEVILAARDGIRFPQSGFVVYDPTEQGFGSETLITAGVQDLRIRLSLTAGGQVPLTVETIGRPEL